MKITEEQLKTTVDYKDAAKGYDYYQKGMVVSCETQECEEDFVVLNSTVIGQYHKEYHQQIKLYKKGTRFELMGACTCPVRFNCKHVFASCLYYVNNLQKGEDSQLDLENWINTLYNIKKPKNLVSDYIQSDSFIVYRIFQDQGKYYREDVHFFKSKLLKSGKLNKGITIRSDSLLYSSSYNKIIDRKDEEIISLLKGMIPRSYSADSQELKGELGGLILKKMIQTGRCYYMNNEQPLFLSDQVLDLQFFWKETTKEKFSLVLDKKYQDLYFTDSSPLMGIDTISNQVFQFSSTIDGKMIEALKKSPEFQCTDLPHIYEKISQVIDQKIVPKPPNYEEKRLKASDIMMEISDDNSNNWFEFSYNVTFEGNQYELVDLISPIIEQYESYEFLPQKFNIEVLNNTLLSIDKSEVDSVLKTIFALYEKKDDNGKIRVLQYEAHMVDMDESIIFKGPKELTELSKKLKNYQGLENILVSKEFTANLREYQQEGLNWLWFLYEFGFGGVLADDMGLGKTIQTLALLSKLKEEHKLTRPSLVIMPTSLIANWKNEAKSFAPNLRILSLHGQDRKNAFKKLQEYDVLLTTYPLIVRDFETLSAQKYFYIILDEAQKIKNPNTKMTKAIKQLESEHRLALSGTPVENHLGELWSIFSFLMPGFLESQSFFKNYYQTPIEKQNDITKKELLNSRIKPFMIRRTKDQVINELPPKSIILKITQFEEKQSKLYESIRITMEKKVKDAITKKGIEKSHITLLDALLKLRQVCCDPSLLKLEEASNVKESAKLELFLDLVEELLSESRKILVFSQFTSMLSIIEKKLVEQKISYLKLTGNTKNREEVINNFKAGIADIFLISLKAGGVGLNLVEADTVIHYDPWWNPAVENQATDRAYRIGQDKPVFVYKLIIENSIEQKIIELQEKKQALQDVVFDSKAEDKDIFKGEELLNLLQ